MRPLLFVALVAFSLSAEAQVRLGGVANAGYDIGYGAPSVGAGAELGWAPPGTALRLGVRASGDLVLVRTAPINVTYGSESRFVGYESNAVRLSAEAVARWERRSWPAEPYLKAGVVFESISALSGDVVSPQEKTDAVAGAGIAWRRVYVEGTHGWRDVSRNRLAVGVTF